MAGGRLERPLLLCLDEAGNIAPLPNLAEIASTAPSHNIQLVTIFHDLAQARSRYGQQAETVVNSHRARMLLPGVADLETLRYFAGLVGEEEARDRTHTTGAGGTTPLDLARGAGRWSPPRRCANYPSDTPCSLYGRIAPTRLRLRLWFEDRRLATARQSDAMSRPSPTTGTSRKSDWDEPVSGALAAQLRGRSTRASAGCGSSSCGRTCAPCGPATDLALRSGWWEDQVQVEALAALSAWVERYDSGEWDDPPGKLALLFDLERVAVLLRAGGEPFHPDRDRLAFVGHLIDLGCQPPPGTGEGRGDDA